MCETVSSSPIHLQLEFQKEVKKNGAEKNIRIKKFQNYLSKFNGQMQKNTGNPKQNTCNHTTWHHIKMLESKDIKKILKAVKEKSYYVKIHNDTNTADFLAEIMKATRQWNDVF